jgi:hypothetical protein
MQTFVPYTNHALSARALDRMRLGKQRVEGLQILNALTGRSKGWVNHPATKMWRGHEAGLCAYVIAVCEEWVARGYNDTVADKVRAIVTPDPDDLPTWWGDTAVHESHQASLVRKMPDHYAHQFPDVDPTVEYVWPSE